MDHGLKKNLPVFVDAFLVKEMMEVAVTYRRKEESKKSGGVRIIHAPNKALKELQKRLLQFLYEWALPSDFFGFVRGKSIVDNALSHRAGERGLPEWLINIDLKDAFPSVTKRILQKTLRRAFDQLQFSERKKIQELGNISINQFREIFLRTVLRWGRLPQGAPTSPYLLNLVLLREGILIAIEDVFMRLGVSLANLSIYADDISITMYKQPSRELIREIIAAIEVSGNFRVNRKKVRTNSSIYAPHEITGIKIFVDKGGIVRATISQRKRNELRGMIHRAAVLLREGREPSKDADGITVNSVRGYIAWLNMVYGERLPSDIRKAVESFSLALKSQ